MRILRLLKGTVFGIVKESFCAAAIGCEFCGCVKDSMLTCPRCNVHYCSLDCYRHKNHLQCSESFYRENVEADLKARGEKFGAKDANPIIEKLKQMQTEDENEETTFDDFENETKDEFPPPEFHPDYLNYGMTEIEKMSEAELDADFFFGGQRIWSATEGPCLCCTEFFFDRQRIWSTTNTKSFEKFEKSESSNRFEK